MIPVNVRIAFVCGACRKPATHPLTGVYLEGTGCGGHQPGEYCYCSPPEVRMEGDCSECLAPFDVLVSDLDF